MLARRRCCALAVTMLRWVRWVHDEVRERAAHQGSLLRAELDGTERRGEQAVEAAAEAERGTAELLEQAAPLHTSAHLCSSAFLNTECIARAITRSQPHANRNPGHNPNPNPNSTPAQVRELEESLAQQRRRTQQAQHRLAETEEQLQLQQMRQQHVQSPRSAGPSRSALAPAPAVLDEVRPRLRSRPHPHPG